MLTTRMNQPLSAAEYMAKKDPVTEAKEQAKLKEACQMFEAQFLKMLFGEMRKTVTKGGLVDGGIGEEYFTDLLDQARAENSAKERSMGIAEMLEQQLSGQGYVKPNNSGLGVIKRDITTDYTPVPEAALTSGHSVTMAMGEGHSVQGVMGQGYKVSQAMPEDDYADASQYQTEESAITSASAASAEEDMEIAAAVTQEDLAPGYILPVQGARVSSVFGHRIHPITGEGRLHRGLDLALPSGSPIVAARDGQVIFSGDRGELGQAVIIEHEDGQRTVYGHCQSIEAETGQLVQAGQQIAAVGMTGLATGPHLHFEIRQADGKPSDPQIQLAGLGDNKV